MWRHGRATPVIGTLLLTMMLVASCSSDAGGAAPTLERAGGSDDWRRALPRLG